MLSLLALAYSSARLAFEAQNAAALSLLRLVSGTKKRTLDRVIPHTMALPPEATPAPVKTAPTRRLTASRVHKKSAAIQKRMKWAKRKAG